MTAVYSDFVFGDPSLYALAEARQARCDLTLLSALDLAWQPDGMQRDGAHVREPVDALLRASLGRAGIAFETIAGTGPARPVAALAAVDRGLAARGRLRPPARPGRRAPARRARAAPAGGARTPPP